MAAVDIPWWGADLRRRVDDLEELKPAVIAERVDALSKRVDSMTSAFNRLLGGIVLATVTFALGVFALLGHS